MLSVRSVKPHCTSVPRENQLLVKIICFMINTLMLHVQLVSYREHALILVYVEHIPHMLHLHASVYIDEYCSSSSNSSS